MNDGRGGMSRRRGVTTMAGIALAAAAVIGGAAAGAAHAQGGGGDDGALPTWIKTLFGFYAAGDIGDGEIIAALEYLINDGVINVGGAGASEPAAAMSPEAKTAMAQADLIEQDVDDAGYWLADMRIELALGGHPQDGRAEFNRALAATERTMEAADAWADTLRAAAGDGVITAAERAAMAAAESTATAAGESERAAYNQEFAPWIEHLIDPYGDALDALNEAFAAAGGDEDDDGG